MPEKSAAFMGAFALLFGAVAAGKTYAARSGSPHAKWIPSGVAFAIGFLNTPSFSLARLIGGAWGVPGRREAQNQSLWRLHRWQ